MRKRAELDLVSGFVRFALALTASALLSTSAMGQADWVRKSPTHIPAARMTPGMAQFTAPGGAPGSGVVMFGGTASDGSTALADTWIWNGSDWTRITSFGQTGTGPHPPAAEAPSMAHNPVTGHVVLVANGQTWILRRPAFCSPIFRNGQVTCFYTGAYYEWDFISPGTSDSPGSRSYAVMDYEPNSKSVILTTGYGVSSRLTGGTQGLLNDTWSFTESGGSDLPGGSPPTGAWKQLYIDISPERYLAAGAKCGPGTAAGAGPLMLFGGEGLAVPAGISYSIPVYGDTWLFATTPAPFQWSGPFNPSPSVPDARGATAMAYYPQSGQVVLFAGEDPAQGKQSPTDPPPCEFYYEDTWNAGCGLLPGWTQLSPSHRPNRRMEHSMATGPNGATVVMFGGLEDTGNTVCVSSSAASNETWVWGKIVACSPPPGTDVPVGSHITCQFDSSFDYASNVNFEGWSATGFAPPNNSQAVAGFHAESPGPALLTARWSDANGSHSEVVEFTITHPH
jgi:hypothetical protein